MRIPDLTLPVPLRRLTRHLPARPASQLLVISLNLMQSRGILAADMGLLAGRHFAISLLDAGMSIHFSASTQGFAVAHADSPPDLRLSATLADFARLLLREEDPDTLFFQRRLRIEGDTELGLIVKNLLDSVDWQHTPLARWVHA